MATTTTSFDNSVGPQVRERGRAQRRGLGALFGLLLVASAQTPTQLTDPVEPSLACAGARSGPLPNPAPQAARFGLGNVHCAGPRVA